METTVTAPSAPPNWMPSRSSPQSGATLLGKVGCSHRDANGSIAYVLSVPVVTVHLPNRTIGEVRSSGGDDSIRGPLGQDRWIDRCHGRRIWQPDSSIS